jgi:hypothetical protein
VHKVCRSELSSCVIVRRYSLETVSAWHTEHEINGLLPLVAPENGEKQILLAPSSTLSVALRHPIHVALRRPVCVARTNGDANAMI